MTGHRIMKSRSRVYLETLLYVVERFYQTYGHLPKRHSNWKFCSKDQKQEHYLCHRLSKLVNGVSYKDTVTKSDFARLSKIGVLTDCGNSSELKFKQYKLLINSLLKFVLEHGTVPHKNKQSSSYEAKLYQSWYALEHQKIYKHFYNVEDKRKLQASGYKPINQIKYETLKSELFEFYAKYGRKPKMYTYKQLLSEERYEHKLALRFYKLKVGRCYSQYLTTREIEEFEKIGISLEIK